MNNASLQIKSRLQRWIPRRWPRGIRVLRQHRALCIGYGERLQVVRRPHAPRYETEPREPLTDREPAGVEVTVVA
jgi:hypothetical protein